MRLISRRAAFTLVEAGFPAVGTVTATDVSCPTSGLGECAHSIEVLVDDQVGNSGSGNGSFSVDTTDPVVTSVEPSGWIDTTDATVVVYYNDGSGSGIDTGAVEVTLDGDAALLADAMHRTMAIRIQIVELSEAQRRLVEVGRVAGAAVNSCDLTWCGSARCCLRRRSKPHMRAQARATSCSSWVPRGWSWVPSGHRSSRRHCCCR